jgi:hypothetical protein
MFFLAGLVVTLFATTVGTTTNVFQTSLTAPTLSPTSAP